MSLCPCLLAQRKSAPTFMQRSLVKVYRGAVKKTPCDLIDINIQYIKFSVEFFNQTWCSVSVDCHLASSQKLSHFHGKLLE